MFQVKLPGVVSASVYSGEHLRRLKWDEFPKYPIMAYNVCKMDYGELQGFLAESGVYGVAVLGVSAPVVDGQFEFARAVRLILNAAQAHFEEIYGSTADVRDTYPANGELCEVECEALLARIEDRAAVAFRDYLGENYIGGDSLALSQLRGEQLCTLLESRTGLTRHLLCRALRTTRHWIHVEDRHSVDPLILGLQEAEDNGHVDYDKCRLVLEIAWLREIENAADVDSVLMRVRGKVDGPPSKPIIVTRPYQQAAK